MALVVLPLLKGSDPSVSPWCAVWIWEMELRFVSQCWQAGDATSQTHVSVRKISSLLVEPSLSQDHVRFSTQCSENMRSSLHSDRGRAGTWFHRFSHRFLLSTLVSHIWKADSYQGLWPGMRENVSLLAVLAIATSLPRGRANVNEQTEKCVRGCATEVDQRRKLGPSIRSFQWPIIAYLPPSFYFSVSYQVGQENNWWWLITSWPFLKTSIMKNPHFSETQSVLNYINQQMYQEPRTMC